MSQYLINIDDDAIKKQIIHILNRILLEEMDSRYSGVGPVIRDAVKDLVYSHKDEIIDKVVDRATREIVKKGLPKLLDRLEN